MDNENLKVIFDDKKRNAKNETFEQIVKRVQNGRKIINGLTPFSGSIDRGEDEQHTIFLALEYRLLSKIKAEKTV